MYEATAKRLSERKTALADELPIEDMLAVKHDIVSFDGADVFQQEQPPEPHR
jgi:hypothetical protein